MCTLTKFGIILWDDRTGDVCQLDYTGNTEAATSLMPFQIPAGLSHLLLLNELGK